MASVAAAVTHDDEAAVVAQMARNIRALGRQRGLYDKDIAALIGMKPETFSTRLGGTSRWLGIEIRKLARALSVSADVIYAESESAFRAALAAESRRTSSEKRRKAAEQGLRVASSRKTPDRRYRYEPTVPLLNTV